MALQDYAERPILAGSSHSLGSSQYNEKLLYALDNNLLPQSRNQAETHPLAVVTVSLQFIAKLLLLKPDTDAQR